MTIMERKFEIFLSSTFEDLQAKRKELIHKITCNRHIPSGMEFFPAGPRDLEHIKKRIEEADIFVIIIGWRYGSNVDSEKTYTKYEFDYAKQLNKPILTFILNTDERKEYRAKLEPGDLERENDKSLEDFVEYILRGDIDGTKRLVKFFSMKEGEKNLINLFEDSLQVAITNLDKNMKGGWVRSKHLEKFDGAPIIDNPQNRKNPFFSKIVSILNQFDKLSARITENVPDLKIAISNYFLDEYLVKLIRTGKHRIFLGSGSTVAYLSEIFIKRMESEKWLGNYEKNINIQTNNIITYLDFILSNGIDIELYPSAPPEKKYGATFGRLAGLPDRNPPKEPRQTASEALPILEDIKRNFIDKHSKNGLAIISASGIEFSNKNGFQGPHVGSYYNKLFKRAILDSGCPTALILDEIKMEKPFVIGKCYAVCNNDLPFVDLCNSAPLAIATSSFSEENHNRFIELLESFGLSNIEARTDSVSENVNIHSLIASNQKFQEIFLPD